MISVGSVYDNDFGEDVDHDVCVDETTGADEIVCESNTCNILDMLAPGTLINAATINDDYKPWSGTSMASPHAAGTAALMYQAAPNISPSQVESILENTGTDVTDDRNYLTFPRINAYNAVLETINQFRRVEIYDHQLSNSTAGPGDTIEITYSINNKINTQLNRIILGASFFGPNGVELIDERHEDQRQITEGYNSYTRQFKLPSDAPTGTYDLVLSVKHDKNNSNALDDGDGTLEYTVQYADELTIQEEPDAPSDLAASAASSSEIFLDWSYNSDNEDGFRVYRNGVRVDTVSADTTSYYDSGLNNNTQYCYRVSAYNSVGESSKSNEDCATTSEDVPEAPTSLSASASSSSQIDLTWSYDSNKEDGFRIYRDGSEIDTVGSNDTDYSDASLESNTQYCYRVSAYNSAGESSKSNEDCATTSDSNRTITITQPNGGESWQEGTNHDITWNSSNAGSSVKIEYSTDGGSSWNAVTSSTSNDGSYTWNTPSEPSTNCLVKVSSTSYSVSDTSDGTFSIEEEMGTITFPGQNLFNEPTRSYSTNSIDYSNYNGYYYVVWLKKASASVDLMYSYSEDLENWSTGIAMSGLEESNSGGWDSSLDVKNDEIAVASKDGGDYPDIAFRSGQLNYDGSVNWSTQVDLSRQLAWIKDVAIFDGRYFVSNSGDWESNWRSSSILVSQDGVNWSKAWKASTGANFGDPGHFQEWNGGNSLTYVFFVDYDSPDIRAVHYDKSTDEWTNEEDTGYDKSTTLGDYGYHPGGMGTTSFSGRLYIVWEGPNEHCLLGSYDGNNWAAPVDLSSQWSEVASRIKMPELWSKGENLYLAYLNKDTGNYEILLKDDSRWSKVKVLSPIGDEMSHLVALDEGGSFNFLAWSDRKTGESTWDMATEKLINVTSTKTPAKFRIDNQGNVYADQSYHGQSFSSGNADLAETAKVTESVEPGDVLSLDPTNPNHYRKSRKPYSSLAAGVVSTKPGMTLSEGRPTEDKTTIALVGTVPVKATTENGPIHPGDLLTTSSKPGYAMVCKDRSKCSNSIVGKALGSLEEGEGKVRMLVVG